MGWVFLWLGLAFVTHIWLCFRVGRSSVPLAIATFFVGFPAALYTFFKQRGEPETSVTVPFLANIVFIGVFIVTAWQTVIPLLEAQEAQYAAAPVATTPLAVERPAVAASAALAASAAASPVEQASAPAAPAENSIESFSAALRSGGLNHTVTRLAASAALPAGVTDAALFSVAPMATAAPASAASAPAGEELSATLFKCESVNACRNLAGLHMQQGGASKRRVLQNGLLMLSLPPASASDADLTPAAVASVFRKL
jgi:hypothetical protein